jgi:hypothetical protein
LRLGGLSWFVVARRGVWSPRGAGLALGGNFSAQASREVSPSTSTIPLHTGNTYPSTTTSIPNWLLGLRTLPMTTPQTVRRWILTGSITAIAATGAIYGAGLRSRQQYEEVGLCYHLLNSTVLTLVLHRRENILSKRRQRI